MFAHLFIIIWMCSRQILFLLVCFSFTISITRYELVAPPPLPHTTTTTTLQLLKTLCSVQYHFVVVPGRSIKRWWRGGGHEMQMMAFQNTLQPIIDKLWLREDFAQHLKWLLKHQERKEMWKCGKVTLF